MSNIYLFRTKTKTNEGQKQFTPNSSSIAYFLQNYENYNKHSHTISIYFVNLPTI